MCKSIRFSCCPAGLSGDSTAGPCDAEGELSAFSLSLSSLHQQHVPLPRLPAHTGRQWLWLPHHSRTQTPLQRLLFNPALYPAHEQHRRCRLSVLHAEELTCCPETSGLHQLQVRQRQPHHLALSDIGGVVVGPHGLPSDDGGWDQPSVDQAAVSLVSCEGEHDCGASALQLHASPFHVPQRRPLWTPELRRLREDGTTQQPHRYATKTPYSPITSELKQGCMYSFYKPGTCQVIDQVCP